MSETIVCNDLNAAIQHYTADGRYRLDMIMPADSPRIAELSGRQGRLRIETGQVPKSLPAHDPQALTLSYASTVDMSAVGRAGMRYRDLLPSRAGGRFIASHITIPGGGPVADYVHFHQVGFQIIFCRRGWVRVVYEDQGPPFVMNAGDCVLQPPTIRHRVLEASPGLEVIEIASPAEHPTFRDHALSLPTAAQRPERDFAGQRFCRHVASDATWQVSAMPGFTQRDTGLGQASAGRVQVRVLRASAPTDPMALAHASCCFRLLHVLAGDVRLEAEHGQHYPLTDGDTVVLPQHGQYSLASVGAAELLEVLSD